METLRDLFQEQMKDLYSAEQQLVKALPKMAKKASEEKLQQGFEKHLKQTEQQVVRLEKIGAKLDFKLSGKKCKAMEGLIAEGKEVLEERGNEAVIDAALIAAAQRVEHYEISAYGSAIALAKRLELADAVNLLQLTLEEEIATDELLSEICESEVYEAAEMADNDEETEDEEDEMQAPPARMKNGERQKGARS